MRLGLPMLFIVATLATGSLTFAQNRSEETNRPQPTEPKKTEPRKKATEPKVSTPKGPVCYDVLVTLFATHPEGGDWDPWPGKRANPDPVIRELATGARASCNDSFTCAMRLTASGKLEFLIEEDDPDASDPVGHAICTAGKACQVGRSNISFSRC